MGGNDLVILPGMQGELNFEAARQSEGYIKWLTDRRLAAKELTTRLGLPLGHMVEVWLGDGVRLRGKLRLEEEVLFIEEERLRQVRLVVDQVAFAYRELESCVRLD